MTAQLEEFEDTSFSGQGILYNVSTSDITFEAVTFYLPIKDAILRDYLDQSNATDFSWKARSVYDCNNYACVFQNPVPDNLYADQVRLLPFCTTEVNGTDVDLAGFTNSCPHQSNTSVVLFSLGRHISADELTFSNSTTRRSYLIIEVKNPRKIYHVTVGRQCPGKRSISQSTTESSVQLEPTARSCTSH